MTIFKKMKLLDLVIIFSDLILGGLLIEYATSETMNKQGDSNPRLLLPALLVFLCTGLYIYGLWTNRRNFNRERPFTLKSTEWISLIFNSIFIITFLIILTDAIFIITPDTLVPVILLSFIPMFFWIWIHIKVFRLAQKNYFAEITKDKIKGLFLIYPFVLITTLPSNLFLNLFFTDPQNILLQKNIVIILLLSIGLAGFSWFLNFIPKKVFISLKGSSLSSKAFFWGLALSYLIKMIFFGFITDG
jgi:hypothetical protein